MANKAKLSLVKKNRVVDGDGVPFSIITQLKFEKFFLARREARELEEEIATALSRGAKIEDGIHTAELVPVRKNGKLYLKLVIQ